MKETVIYKSLPGTHWWIDPWGQRHVAEALSDAAIIVPTTKRYMHHNGYTAEYETVYADAYEPDREWAAIPPMDFGASTGYLALPVPPPEDPAIGRWWHTFSKGRKLMLLNQTPITSEEQLRALIEGQREGVTQ